MARPKMNPDDKKGNPIPIKFSPYNKMRVKERAKKEHLPVSVWIRKVVLEKLNHLG